jgi:acetyltransferase EpsM
VGEGSNIGIGASVIQGVSIGKWVVVGAGTVIIDDIPDYAVVVGIPGKIIKFNKRND